MKFHITPDRMAFVDRNGKQRIRLFNGMDPHEVQPGDELHILGSPYTEIHPGWFHQPHGN